MACANNQVLTVIITDRRIIMPPAPLIVKKKILKALGVQKYGSVETFIDILELLPIFHPYTNCCIDLWGSKEAGLEFLRAELVREDQIAFYTEIQDLCRVEANFRSAIPLLKRLYNNLGAAAVQDDEILQGHRLAIKMMYCLLNGGVDGATNGGFYGFVKDVCSYILDILNEGNIQIRIL